MEIFKDNQIKRPFVQESNLQLQVSDPHENQEILHRLISPKVQEEKPRLVK